MEILIYAFKKGSLFFQDQIFLSLESSLLQLFNYLLLLISCSIMHFVNVHLFHDESNFVAMEKVCHFLLLCHVVTRYLVHSL